MIHAMMTFLRDSGLQKLMSNMPMMRITTSMVLLLMIVLLEMVTSWLITVLLLMMMLLRSALTRGVSPCHIRRRTR